MPKLVPIEPAPEDISTRDDEIHRMRLDGVRIRTIARTFKIPVELVESVLDRACVKIDAQYRASTIAVELERLEEMHRVFYAKALAGDGSAAHVAIRIAEHRASILGLFAPARHDPIQMVEAGTNQTKRTSTDKIMAALALVGGGKARQRAEGVPAAEADFEAEKPAGLS